MPTKSSNWSASSPLIEVERFAARSLAFLIVWALNLTVMFCFRVCVMFGTSQAARILRAAALKGQHALKALVDDKKLSTLLTCDSVSQIAIHSEGNVVVGDVLICVLLLLSPAGGGVARVRT